MSRLFSRVLVTVVFGLTTTAVVYLLTSMGQTEPQPYPLVSETAPWAPPEWMPSSSADVWLLPELNAAPVFDTGPRVASKSAIIVDMDSGDVLWERAADERRSVASLTKMVSALAAKSLESDFANKLCVTPEQWPSMRGAISKFETGVCHEGWDYLGAALVKSDNRGAMGLAGLAGVGHADFLDAMHRVSREIGLADPDWADPTGLEDENMASARDMLKAVVAMSSFDDLSLVSSAPLWRIERKKGAQFLYTTNRTIGDSWETHAAKTGYTSTAGYCFATVVTTVSGRRFGVAVLGAPRERARFSDARALVRWAEQLTNG